MTRKRNPNYESVEDRMARLGRYCPGNETHASAFSREGLPGVIAFVVLILLPLLFTAG